jgi:hypothetical protein
MLFTHRKENNAEEREQRTRKNKKVYSLHGNRLE